MWEVKEAGEGARFELQESRARDFAKARTRYEGIDRATYVSGLPGGDFYYRVRELPEGNSPGPWSKTLQVRVDYVSLKLVFLLVAVGLLVFVSTVLAVLTGHRRAARAKAIEP